MEKVGRLGICFFVIFMFLLQLSTQAQSKKYFVVTGKIVPETDMGGTGVIEVTKNETEKSTIDIPKNGRFRFELEFFNEFSLNFKYPGHFNKIINVSTVIPQEVWERDNDFPPFPMIVQLIKEFEGIDKSFALKPSGRIFYGKDIDNFEKESFISDLQFLEQIATAKSQANQVEKEAQSITKENAQDLAAKQKYFDQLIKEADTHYQRGEYQMALMKYLEAKKLFPEKAYPTDRVAELQDLVKALEITEKQKTDLEQKYKAAIAKANGFFEQKSYISARPAYEEAISFKPGDVFANGRINEIDQLLALQEKQKQYNDLIAQADNNYKSKNYDQAIALFNQAKQLVPEDQYPVAQINLINQEKQQQAKLEQLEKDYNQALQTANTQTEQKDYLQALNSYKKALELKPESKIAKDKIVEMEQAIVGVETDKKYQEAIKLADQALAENDLQRAKISYQEALKIKNTESYPQAKLAEISTSEANEIQFNDFVAKAENAFVLRNYDESLKEFNQALAIKPLAASVKKRIEEIQNLKNQQVTQKEYDDLIVQADKAFYNNELEASIVAYDKALQLKKTEAYPKEQIKKVEAYLSIVKKADRSFGAKDYAGSLNSFKEALALKPDDSYAFTKITEINKIAEDQKILEEQAQATLRAYNEALKNADQLFAAQNYAESLNKYKEAANIKASESYPKKRIKEVDSILEAQEKEKIRKEKEYQGFITQANKLLQREDYLNAQVEYRKALDVKPEESYPKEQISKIDTTLAENRRKEEEETQKQILEKQNLAFNQAIASGNKAFSENDFNAAKSGYENALTIKPNDAMAKEKLGQTEAKLAQITRMTQAYNTAITEANKQLTAKRYKEAKEKYVEALQYLPDSDYPKRQIVKIDEVLAQQDAEIKLKQDFDKALAEGESLLKNKELVKAKNAFMVAYNLIPSESIPPKRIAEIDGLLADQVKKELELKQTLEAYREAIQRADTHFGSKEYGSAKLVYNEALLIKADEKYPVDQLALVDKLMKEQNEVNYKTAISKADNAFNSNLFEEAVKAYQEALTYKTDDPYAIRKLKEIEQKKADLEAEKNRLKKLEADYNALIADANKDLRDKEYQNSKGKYQSALTLKPLEVYPKDQIAKIDQLLSEQQREEATNREYIKFLKAAEEAFNQNKLKEARDLYQKGYNLRPFEPVPPMRIAQIDAMLAQLTETAKLAAMEEAQRLAKEKADRQQYNNAITAGDKAFAEKQYKIARVHYNDALIALPNEKYPKDQIAKIDELLVQEEMNKSLAIQKAQKDSIQNAKNRLFDMAIADAKDYEQNKRYNEAIQKYNEAIGIKPEQSAVIQKYIKDIEDKIRLLAQQDAEYKRIIKLADDLYADTKLNEALTEYRNSVTIKPDEEYPKKQIQEIQSILAAREQNYADAIKNADKAFDASDWINAKIGYTEALGIKPNEKYPSDRLKEVTQKIADANIAAIANSSENKAYNESIDKGEKAFKENLLTIAKMHFEVAKSLNPSEKLPIERIKEISKLIDQQNKERLAQTQREIDEKYRQAISVADNSFREKSYSIARLQYQQASLIKPEESYPKNQITLIDKLMNQEKPIETYAFKLPEIEIEKPVAKPIYNPSESAQATEERAKSFKIITDYDEAVKKADELFGVKDYSVARFYYYKANEIKPAEEYPKNQIELIRKLIDSQLSSNDISGYDQAIAQADKAFANKDYSIAKFFYYKALDIKSWEKYPKDRINEILALTNSLLSEKEEKEYRDMIARADEAYFNKDISISRFYYNRAIAIKKNENYPQIKLKDIHNLIEQDARDKENEKYRKIIEEADQAMQLENFSMARFNYNKALTMKPDEKYPKDQLKRIKEALDKSN